jgi:hypothetical protein
MSATIDPTPATAAPVNGQAASPVDYIRALAPEEKEAVFIALLQELIEVNGGGHGLIPFQTADGKSLGYYVPPEASRQRYEQMLAEMPPEVREMMTKPLPPDLDFDDAIPIEDLIASLRAEEDRSPG